MGICEVTVVRVHSLKQPDGIIAASSVHKAVSIAFSSTRREVRVVLQGGTRYDQRVAIAIKTGRKYDNKDNLNC